MLAGAQAARDSIPLHECPYRHPAMRASWLKGFARSNSNASSFSLLRVKPPLQCL
nr:CrpP family ICE-associated protein [Pseudomonas syringae]